MRIRIRAGMQCAVCAGVCTLVLFFIGEQEQAILFVKRGEFVLNLLARGSELCEQPNLYKWINNCSAMKGM